MSPPTADAYLRRLGFGEEDVARLLAEGPSLAGLTEVHTAQLRCVPFENLDQHDHPAGECNFPAAGECNFPAVPRKTPKSPSLCIESTLTKIVGGRGGFCFEINPAFQWLLQQLGYKARLCLADVRCASAIPAHMVILVFWPDAPCEYLVDPGFGDAPRTPLPIEPVKDVHVDDLANEFQFVPGVEVEQSGGYSRLVPTASCPTMVLMRSKKDSNVVESRVQCALLDDEAGPLSERTFEPMYRFALEDDLALNCEEFVQGLNHVLTKEDLFFTQKRLCVKSTAEGHITLTRNRFKVVSSNAVASDTPIVTEDEFRSALFEHFGVTL